MPATLALSNPAALLLSLLLSRCPFPWCVMRASLLALLCYYLFGLNSVGIGGAIPTYFGHYSSSLDRHRPGINSLFPSPHRIYVSLPLAPLSLRSKYITEELQLARYCTVRYGSVWYGICMVLCCLVLIAASGSLNPQSLETWGLLSCYVFKLIWCICAECTNVRFRCKIKDLGSISNWKSYLLRSIFKDCWVIVEDGTLVRRIKR